MTNRRSANHPSRTFGRTARPCRHRAISGHWRCGKNRTFRAGPAEGPLPNRCGLSRYEGTLNSVVERVVEIPRDQNSRRRTAGPDSEPLHLRCGHRPPFPCCDSANARALTPVEAWGGLAGVPRRDGAHGADMLVVRGQVPFQLASGRCSDGYCKDRPRETAPSEVQRLATRCKRSCLLRPYLALCFVEMAGRSVVRCPAPVGSSGHARVRRRRCASTGRCHGGGNRTFRSRLAGRIASDPLTGRGAWKCDIMGRASAAKATTKNGRPSSSAGLVRSNNISPLVGRDPD